MAGPGYNKLTATVKKWSAKISGQGTRNSTFASIPAYKSIKK